MTSTVTSPHIATTASRGVLFARAAAVVTVFAIAARTGVGQGVTIGHLATLVTAPLWFPALSRRTGGRWLGWTGLAATIAAVWLTIASSADHDTTQNDLVANTLLIAGSVAAIGVLLWARDVIPGWLVAVVYGVGMLAAVVTHQDTLGFNAGSGGEVNVWKFALAVPVAVILLGLAMRTGRRSVEVVVLLALAAASARFDSRSYFGEFMIAAILVLWQTIPVRGRRASALRVTVIFGVVLFAVYVVGTQLVVGGALGSATQARSVEQIDRAGSIIVGGRPEMGATAALFLAHPFGFGAGTIASGQDIQTAKSGMIAVDYDPENGYVENFLFGDKIELHSTAADIWAYAGFAGIVFAVVLLVLLIAAVSRGIATRTASGLLLFAVVQGSWDLFFNPLYSSAPIIVIALGFGLVRLRGPGADPRIEATGMESSRILPRP